MFAMDGHGGKFREDLFLKECGFGGETFEALSQELYERMIY